MNKKLTTLKDYSTLNVLVVSFMAGFIPFPVNAGNAAIILGCAYALYLFLMNKVILKKQKFLSFGFIFPIAFFLVVVISALLSKDVGAGLKQVDKNLLLILIAFALIIIHPLDKKALNKVLFVFSVSSVISALVLFLVGAIRIMNGAGIDMMFFHEFGAFFDLHPVYIAVNLCVSLFFLSSEYLSKALRNPRKHLTLFFAMTIALLGIFLCASKVVIFVFISLYVFQLFQLSKNLGYRIVLLLVVCMLLLGLYYSPILSKRFAEGLHFNITHFEPTNDIASAKVFSNEEKASISDLEIRYLMLKIGVFHTWQDGKILFGYGVGDVQHYFDYYYMLYGLAPGWFEGYNLHNQYLQYLVTYGLFVLLFFCSYLVYSFYFAIRSKNLVHIYFLILMAVVFLFECVLSRNKGIVIFIFINTLFLFNYGKHENRNIGN